MTTKKILWLIILMSIGGLIGSYLTPTTVITITHTEESNEVVRSAEVRYAIIEALSICESGDIELGTKDATAVNENEPNGWNSRGEQQWQYPSMKDKFREWGIDDNLSREMFKTLAHSPEESYWITERTFFDDGESYRWSQRCVSYALSQL